MATPLCPYFGRCGGCNLQHLDYPQQLERKKKEIVKELAKVHPLDEKEIKVFSAQSYHYRNRMDFLFHAGGLGLRQQGTKFNLVDIKECAISLDLLNLLLKEVRDFFSGADYVHPKTNHGTFRYAVLRVTKAGESAVSFVLNEDSPRLGAGIEKIKQFAPKTKAQNVVVCPLPQSSDLSTGEEFFVVKGAEMMQETYLGRRFWYSTQGFFQNNPVMAEKMQEYVHQLLSKYDTKKAHLLDLYGGVGTFGIINAELFQSVTIVESVPSCIEAAKRNFQENQISNAQALLLDAKDLHKLKLSSPLLVITDPPRSGMHPKTVQQLNFLQPEVFIYVSCNPQQLKRELSQFRNYELKSVALFDLFPQTNHSEVVAEMVKK